MHAAASAPMCNYEHARGSLAAPAAVGTRSIPPSAVSARKDAEELTEKAASIDATSGCPGEQGETPWKRDHKGMSPENTSLWSHPSLSMGSSH